MQNPEEREIETGLHEPPPSNFEQLDDMSLEPVASQPPAYVKEPLFNKKVMLLWALGAAAVWFAVSFVLPIAFESARTAIVQSIKEAEGTGSNVIIERNGQKITITTKPSKPTATPAPPAQPATAAPVVKGEPVQPAQGPKKTEPARR